jgi:hypothetical protein
MSEGGPHGTWRRIAPEMIGAFGQIKLGVPDLRRIASWDNALRDDIG